MLALRVWVGTYANWLARFFRMLSMGRASRAAQDWALRRAARKMRGPELLWPENWGGGWDHGADAFQPEADEAEAPALADVQGVLARAGKLQAVASSEGPTPMPAVADTAPEPEARKPAKKPSKAKPTKKAAKTAKSAKPGKDVKDHDDGDDSVQAAE